MEDPKENLDKPKSGKFAGATTLIGVVAGLYVFIWGGSSKNPPASRSKSESAAAWTFRSDGGTGFQCLRSGEPAGAALPCPAPYCADTTLIPAACAQRFGAP